MKTAIVTGASGNLGTAVVHTFARNGWQVAGSYHAHSNRPLPSGDLSFQAHAVDLGVETLAAEWVRSVVSTYDAVEAGVLTVGGFSMGTIANTDSEELFQQYRLNFETAYHVARPLFTHMLEKGRGRIFFIGSRAGRYMTNSKGMVAYGMAKSLLFRLAELMNAEAEGTDVKVCVVVPGTIDTQANRQAMPDADFSTWVKPEAIAERIHSLITGEEAWRGVVEC